MSRPALLLAFVSTLAVGCGSAVPEVAEPAIDRLAPSTLYPMLSGAQWVYDVDTGGDEPPTLGIFEVIEATGQQRSIANNRGMDRAGRVRHGDPVGYRLEEEGIQHVASASWLLRRPIELGAEWTAMGGRTARVTDIAATVEVFAGRFDDCVEVTESGGEDGRTVVTTYCPQVGPVVIQSTISTELTMREVVTRARLRSYDDGTGGFDDE